jgi:hypothetical protein
MTYKRNDPDKIAVQLNIKVPFDFREMLTDQAEQRRMSLAALVREALDEKYEVTYVRWQAQQTKAATKAAGATT